MNRQKITVGLVLVPEVAASILLSIYDVFRLFEQVVPGDIAFEITIVAESAQPVLTASSIPLQAGATVTDRTAYNVIVVPALLLTGAGWQCGNHPQLLAWLRYQHGEGAVMCSACSGIFPLMETGLFDNEPVTCHWYYEPMLRVAM